MMWMCATTDRWVRARLPRLLRCSPPCLYGFTVATSIIHAFQLTAAHGTVVATRLYTVGVLCGLHIMLHIPWHVPKTRKTTSINV